MKHESRINQRNPKSLKHEKRQRYVRISEASGLEAYKQNCQSFPTTQEIQTPLGKL